jgi:hypothetical protein
MDINDVDRIVPESFKEAIRNGQFHKVAMALFGFKNCSLEEVTEHFGTKLASRKYRWQAVNDGLEALKSLKNG